MSRARPSPTQRSFLGRFLRRQAWLIVITGYAAIFFAAWFPVDYRDASAAHSLGAWLTIMIRALAFHLGLLVAVVAGLALIGRCLGVAICSIPLVLFCVGEDLGDLRTKHAPAAAGETIAIMTFSLGPGADKAAVLEEIADANPDIILLQQFSDRWKDVLHNPLTESYRYFREIPRNDDSFGTAIYSRRPFDEAEERRSGKFASLSGNRIQQARAVIRVDNRRLAIYNVRLMPALRSDAATICRAQFADLADQLDREKLPAMIAGDFNFTRRTPQGQKLQSLQGLRYEDAQRWVGKGRGGTWPANTKAAWFPLLQLDHVYVSPQLVVTECRTGQAAGSDHLPVIARVGFAAPDSSGEGDGPDDPANGGSGEGAIQLHKTDLNASSTTATSAGSSDGPEPGPGKSLFPPLKLSLPVERPPGRAPFSPADGPPPPRRAPWSPGDDPPDRPPDAPPARVPGASP